MPRIQIRDYQSAYHTIDSSNVETVSAWIVETLSKLTSVNMALGPLEITIIPLEIGFENGKSIWDWPPSKYPAREFLGGRTARQNALQLIEKLINWTADNKE